MSSSTDPTRETELQRQQREIDERQAARSHAVNQLIDWYDARPLRWTFEFPRTESDVNSLSLEYHATRNNDLRAALQELEPDCITRNEEWLATGADPEQAAALPQLREWHAARPQIAPDTIEALRDQYCGPSPKTLLDWGAHWQILRDRETVYSGGDATAYAHSYAASLPPEWRDSVIIYLAAGKPVIVARHTAQRYRMSVIEAWAASQRGRSGDGPRWEVIAHFNQYDIHTEWTGVPIPPAAPVAPRITSVRDLVAQAPAMQQASAIVPTGIPPLDRALAIGGIPLRGARCILQGAPGSRKTTLMLHVADTQSTAGYGVVWLATRDESAESIYQRWQQRQGVPRSEAARMSMPGDHAQLAENVYLIDGTKMDLEDVLAIDGVEILVIDSLQQVRTRAGAGLAEAARVERVLELIGERGHMTWMTSHLVRAADRRDPIEASRGGAIIEYSATMLVHVDREGDDLTLRVIKSRYGGEGQAIGLRVDGDRQRVIVPEGRVVADGGIEGRIRRDVLATLAEEGPLTLRAIEGAVRGTATVIRQTVRAMLAEGMLVERDGKITPA